ncbi:MAG TPA: DUF1697 domain-containing protein [Verrucomicrobiae bacterium]|nr:DUF1697 domain-containing protein [Verrucomicrobiae bacterium]
MPAYVAMLRGINVTGRNMIKMERLRASFEALGFKNVQTYLQSGNVIFTAPGAAPKLQKQIEARLLADHGFEVKVFLRTGAELAAVVEANPFAKNTALEPAKLHVTFLSEDAPATAAETLKALVTQQEEFHIAGREIYLQCPASYGNTKLSNNNIERKLKLGATTRNWRSVNALCELVNASR